MRLTSGVLLAAVEEAPIMTSASAAPMTNATAWEELCHGHPLLAHDVA